jgi:hypothetical protein
MGDKISLSYWRGQEGTAKKVRANENCFMQAIAARGDSCLQ